MSQKHKLQEAFDLIKEAEEIISTLQDENEDSLNNYYSYSLKLIESSLNQLSDNSHGYLTNDTNIQEIIDSESDQWHETEEE